jgi:amino acid permease
VTSSVFTIVILCLGTGTLMVPYILFTNGFYLGIALVFLGAAVCYYSGLLIAECSDYCKAARYEDIAMQLYGRKMATFTSFMILLTMTGFTIAYVVLVRYFSLTFLPS